MKTPTIPTEFRVNHAPEPVRSELKKLGPRLFDPLFRDAFLNAAKQVKAETKPQVKP